MDLYQTLFQYGIKNKTYIIDESFAIKSTHFK